MNIVIFNTLYYPNFIGGAERSVQELAEGLVKKGNKVTVISTSLKENIQVVNGVLVYYIKTNNLYWGFNNESHSGAKKVLWHGIDSYNLGVKKKVQKLLKEINPDIIHTNNLSGFSVIIWDISNKLGVKIVHTVRDYYLMCPKTTMFKDGENCKTQCLKCKGYSFNKRISSRKVDAIIGISKFIKNKHLGHSYFKNTLIQEVIGNSVGGFKESSNEIINDTIKFGFIGQINEAKGVELLVRVFNSIQIDEKWELHIAGTGNKLEYLKSGNNDNRIQFLGKVDSRTFYSTINVLIVPSLWEEPFGRVVMEGVNSGIPVYGSNRGGIKELLPEENLFEPTYIDLRNKIISVFKNSNLLLTSLIESDNMVESYQHVYQRITSIPDGAN